MDFCLQLRSRKIQCVLCICIGFGSLVFYGGTNLGRRFRGVRLRDPEGNFSLHHAPGKLLGSASCSIPDFDPSDKVVDNIFFQDNIKRCPKAPPFFIRSLVEGSYTVPYLDDILLWKFFRLKKHNLRCLYRAVVRDEDAKIRDNAFRFLKSKELVFGQEVDSEYIWIECSRYAFRKKFYEQPLLLPRSKCPKGELNQPTKPNVLVLGLDSVSRLNFHRLLKRTRNFLLDDRANSTVELLGYNKVGLNSGPNQIPLLTGKRFRPNGLYETVRKHYVDNMTNFIWRDYAKAGYATLFLEEQSHYGLFVWPELNGFFNVPTDYWPRPIMQAIDKSDLKLRAGSNVCVGPEPASAIYLNYLKDVFRVSQSCPLWLYAWFSELSHDELTGAARADDLFCEFLQNLAKEGYLDNTVIFFLADHGFRFGPLRHFPLGRYEDQLPFGFVLVPGRFAAQAPFKAVLDKNAQRLVTVYDLHKAMLGLVSSTSTGSKSAYNIFTERIPEDRTCEQAQIDFEYCSCYSTAEQSDPVLKVKLGSILVSQLNYLLDRNNDTRCRRWKLKSVDEASAIYENSIPRNAFRVSVTTDPPGNFEACIRQLKNGSFVLSSNADRTDFYSRNAHCVIPSSYERYCYCK